MPFCAAQAAWGHQLGFSRSNPPCLKCANVIAGFPVREPGMWKSNSLRRGAPFSLSIQLRTAANSGAAEIF